MPPLWQYFLPLRKAKAVESIAAPKGHGPRTPAAFPLQTGHFKAPPEEAMIAVVDPRQAGAVMVGRGRCSLCTLTRAGELRSIFRATTRSFQRAPAALTSPSPRVLRGLVARPLHCGSRCPNGTQRGDRRG
jgi:hypothetical protein